MGWGRLTSPALTQLWNLVWERMLERRVERHFAGSPNHPVHIVKADPAWHEQYRQARSLAIGPEYPFPYPPPVRPIPVEMLTMALVEAHKNGLGYFFPLLTR